MKPITDYGYLMTIEEFDNAVKSHCFIDYDGFGFYSTENEMEDDFDKKVWPSEVLAGNGPSRKGFTHIVWYNR